MEKSLSKKLTIKLRDSRSQQGGIKYKKNQCKYVDFCNYEMIYLLRGAGNCAFADCLSRNVDLSVCFRLFVLVTVGECRRP